MTRYKFYIGMVFAFTVVCGAGLALSLLNDGGWAMVAFFCSAIMIVFSSNAALNSPRYKAGDILVRRDIDRLERWEKDAVYPVRVEDVGERSYRILDSENPFHPDGPGVEIKRSFEFVNSRYRLAEYEDLVGLPTKRCLGYKTEKTRALS